MRFTDNFRRRVIAEIQQRARVVWDPTEPGFHSCGARSDAFNGVAYRLHDASIQQDIRRMWHRWVRAVYDYKLKRLSRKPKFYNDLYFVASLNIESISMASILVNRLSAVIPVGEAVRALKCEAVLIVNFGRYCDDPFQEALAENAIPIDSPLKTRLLKTICGSGSLLRHGLVIVEVGDDGTCSIKCVTTRPIIGAQRGRGRSQEIIVSLEENGEPKRMYMPDWTERDRVAFWLSKFIRPSALVLQVNSPAGKGKPREVRISAQGMTRTVDDGFFAVAQTVGAESRTLTSDLRFFEKKVTTYPVSIEEVNNVLSHLRVTMEMLHKSKVGAIIVLATSKSDFLTRLGTMSNKPGAMEAVVSAQLLLAIFDKSSELHDGAVVIDMYGAVLGSGASIRWAGLLSDKTQGKKAVSNASQKDGSRHRAADHLNSKTGFPVVVVSEQDGTLSVACRWTDVNGRIRNEPERLRGRETSLRLSTCGSQTAPSLGMIQQRQELPCRPR